ncbi:hypothetical protein F53441_2098 [Fusarium austroafricanum]|uniref:ATPase AAA-type core domain-containing protein n=1 Tax=Fusarium austroafricanum TaxID=2364996 RepID=A0A8H4KTV5_9HYPO|nr:hypothetical protein F53441_2098 [Fusarium austroafricanum]
MAASPPANFPDLVGTFPPSADPWSEGLHYIVPNPRQAVSLNQENYQRTLWFQTQCRGRVFKRGDDMMKHLKRTMPLMGSCLFDCGIGDGNNQPHVKLPPRGSSPPTPPKILVYGEKRREWILKPKSGSSIKEPAFIDGGADLTSEYPAPSPEGAHTVFDLEEVDVEDLRADGFHISRRVSWEKMIEDFKAHFAKVIDDLEYNMHLIVRLGYQGAIYVRPKAWNNLLEHQRSRFICYLVPDKAEGDILRAHKHQIPGIDMAFVAGLVASIAKQAKAEAIDDPKIAETNWGGSGACVALIPSVCKRQVLKLVAISSREARLTGLKTLSQPLTAERTEIECFRSTAAEIDEYLVSSRKKPLSIAVFGPPGAGKSFGITQVIKTIMPETEAIEVNVSQFSSHQELLATFYKVRDQALSGKVLVVLFDEFDSVFGGQDFGWLKYFLAPMNDGYFLDDGQEQSLKQAIFIFIGATSHSYGDFIGGMHNDKRAKKPDFASRLGAYIDIRGPNDNS